MGREEMLRAWEPPAHWRRITTLDAHTGGEPFRIVTEGFPELRGETILAKRREARQRWDALRKALMWEPRGHADMYGCLVTEPCSPEADFGVLFLHNEGYSSMCGHGVIAMATVAAETGLVEAVEPETALAIDTPAGLVRAWARWQEGRVVAVRFRNVPSFVAALDQVVDVPGRGPLGFDLAYGGAFYAYVDAEVAGVGLGESDARSLIEAGNAIKRAVVEQFEIVHPFEQDLSFLYGVIFVGAPHRPEHHSRNVCIFADGEVDRSPTGTGVSGRLAIHHARGELAPDESIVIESLVGSTFSGRVVETLRFGPYEAILPEVAGRAFITGRHEFLLDPEDPMAEGFLLR